jgi:hypothetical protein
MDPSVKRLAVPVEDHELLAGDFEGVHLGASRGSGAVIIWDEGSYEMVRNEPNHLTFVLSGSKLTGGFAITKTGDPSWILVKMNDDHARRGSDVVAEDPLSVRTGRSWQEMVDAE